MRRPAITVSAALLACLLPAANAFGADVDALLRLEQYRYATPVAAAAGDGETALVADGPPGENAAPAWTPEPGVLYAYG